MTRTVRFTKAELSNAAKLCRDVDPDDLAFIVIRPDGNITVRRTPWNYVLAVPGRKKITGWIYFIRCGEHVKIGYASDVESRIPPLQTGSPQPMRLLLKTGGSRLTEKYYHSRFADLRENGEWFRLEGSLAEFLDQCYEMQHRGRE